MAAADLRSRCVALLARFFYAAGIFDFNRNDAKAAFENEIDFEPPFCPVVIWGVGHASGIEPTEDLCFIYHDLLRIQAQKKIRIAADHIEVSSFLQIKEPPCFGG